MNYRKCVYFVEGPCEKQLIEVLNKQHPYLLTPGKVNVLNPIVRDLLIWQSVDAA